MAKVGNLFKGWFKEETPPAAEGAEMDASGEGSTDGSRRTLDLSGSPLSHDTSSFSAIGSANEHDPKYEKTVLDAIEAANVPGIDYAEYRDSVNEAIKSDGKSEEAAFTSVFKILGKADKTLTVEKLMSSSSTYIGVAQQVQSSFNNDCKEIIRVSEQELNSLLKDIDKLLGTIKNKAAAEELKRTMSEIASRHVQAVRSHQERRMAKMKFVVDRVTGEIRKDQERIQNILGGLPVSNKQ